MWEDVWVRLSALGLRDVVQETRDSRSPFVRCHCRADVCGHAPTVRRAGNVKSQLDHFFVTDALLPRVTRCVVANDDDIVWSISDHCPVIIDLE